MLSIKINEKLIFNCLLENPSLIIKIKENYFISQTGKDLYIILLDLYKNKVSFTLEHILAFGNKINTNINEEIINSVKLEYDINKFDFYLDKLKKEFCKKDIQKIVTLDLLKETSIKNSFNITKVKDLTYQINKRLSFIENNETVIKSTSDLLDSLKESILDRANQINKYSTGDSYLDFYFTEGFLPPEQTTIFADSGIGKTTYKQSIIKKRIFKQLPTLDINLELEQNKYVQRYLCDIFNEPVSYFYPDSDGNISSDLIDRIEKVKNTIFNSPYYGYVREDNLSIAGVEEKIIQFKLEKKINDGIVVFLDVATRLKDFEESDNFANSYQKALTKLSDVAYRQKVHFVNIVHTNREAENIKITKIEDIDKLRLSLKAIKNSSAFEKDSRLILGLMRKKFYMQRYFPDAPELEITDDIMEVSALKYNEGNLFNLKYLYTGELFKVTKYEE